MNKISNIILASLVLLLVVILGVVAGILITGKQVREKDSVIGNYLDLNCNGNSQNIDDTKCPTPTTVKDKELELLMGTIQVKGTWSAQSSLGHRDVNNSLYGTWAVNPDTLVTYMDSDKEVGVIGGITQVYDDTEDVAKSDYDDLTVIADGEEFGVVEKSVFASENGMNIYKVRSNGEMGEYVMYTFGYLRTASGGEQEYIYNRVVISAENFVKYEKEVLAIIDSYKK